MRLDGEGRREAVKLRWGLIPFWSKDAKIGYRTINARAETVADKPSFRAAFKARRCIVPASGFYEWTGAKGQKQAYYIAGRDGTPLSFAGLWEGWKEPESGDRIETFTIIVTEANDFLQPWHHRMPVILESASFGAWLDGSAGTELLRPAANDRLQGHMVGPNVGNVKNDYAELIERAGAHA